MGTHEFGEYLRTKREEKGLSIADVSQRTKIHMRHIRAIEEGRLEALPGLVYARAFVRHYARAVGEDPDEAAAQFNQVVELQGESDAIVRRRRRSRRRAKRESRFPWPWVVVIALLAALGFLVAQVVDLGQGASPPPAPQGPPTSLAVPDVPVLAPVSGPDAESPVGISEATPLEMPMPTAEDAALIEAAPDFSDGAKTEPQDEPAREPSHLLIAAEDERVVAAVADLAGVVLKVDVERACWFHVEADGAVIFSGLVGDGESVTWVADETLRVKYGRPEGVLITLNGEFLGRPGTGVITRVYGSDGAVRIADAL